MPCRGEFLTRATHCAVEFYKPYLLSRFDLQLEAKESHGDEPLAHEVPPIAVIQELDRLQLLET